MHIYELSCLTLHSRSLRFHLICVRRWGASIKLSAQVFVFKEKVNFAKGFFKRKWILLKFARCWAHLVTRLQCRDDRYFSLTVSLCVSHINIFLNTWICITAFSYSQYSFIVKNHRPTYGTFHITNPPCNLKNNNMFRNTFACVYKVELVEHFSLDRPIFPG